MAKEWFGQAAALGDRRAQQQMEMLAPPPPEGEEGEVVKTVVAAGDGKTFPQKGDQLFMHYTGTLAADGVPPRNTTSSCQHAERGAGVR